MPKKEKKIVHIHLGKHKYKTVMTAGSYEEVADEPAEQGGGGMGPDPYDYLLMSLGSCSVITMKMYAERKEWSVDHLYIELRHSKEHTRDCADCEDPSARIDKIEKEIIIRGDLSGEQLDKLLEISEKCPVHRTLMQDVEIASTIEKRG